MPPKEAATSFGDSVRQRPERLGSGLVGSGVDDRGAGIPALPDDGVEGDLSKQWYSISETGGQRCGDFVATATSKDVVAMLAAAVRAECSEIAHVLHDADHSLVEHGRHGSGALGDFGRR